MSSLELQRYCLEENLRIQEDMLNDTDESIRLLEQEKSTLEQKEFEENYNELLSYKAEISLGVEEAKKALEEFDRKYGLSIKTRKQGVLRREANYGK